MTEIQNLKCVATVERERFRNRVNLHVFIWIYKVALNWVAKCSHFIYYVYNIPIRLVRRRDEISCFSQNKNNKVRVLVLLNLGI